MSSNMNGWCILGKSYTGTWYLAYGSNLSQEEAEIKAKQWDRDGWVDVVAVPYIKTTMDTIWYALAKGFIK